MDMHSTVQEIINNIEKVLIGKHDTIELAVLTLISGGHLLLEDVPGVGKTTLANALAKSIHCGFTRIQFTPDTLPSDVTGVTIYNLKTGEFEFIKGAIMNQIILADEINRTSPKTQASLLEAMAEGQVSVDGKTYVLPKPFMVIATQNPIDYLGTYNLPEAQLDRFFMKLSLGYPNKEAEGKMIAGFLNNIRVENLEPVADETQIIAIGEKVKEVKIHRDLIQYIIDIINATRNNNNIALGASPRATLALIRATQACAFMNQRDFVIPDDIRKMLNPVLLHRLVISADAKMNKKTPEQILSQIVSSIKVPILTNGA